METDEPGCHGVLRFRLQHLINYLFAKYILMNQSIQQIQSPSLLQSNVEQDEAIDIRKYLGFLFDNRWLIAGIAFFVTLFGIAYVLIASPLYESNLLIQVQDNAGTPSHMLLGDLARGPEAESSRSTSEMEILRSRLVASRAVDNARLYIDVEPKYFPLIGQAIARRNKELSEPGLFGYGGYVWGNEKADVSVFNVPQRLEGMPFELTARDNGGFLLTQEDEEIEIQGRVGETLKVRQGQGEIELRIEQLVAKPGAKFQLTRLPKLEIVENLQDALKITEKGKQSGIINVTLQGEDPELTRSILYEVGREYLRQNEERHTQNAGKVLSFLNKQLPDLKRDLELSETKYNDLRNKRGTVDLGEEAKAALEQSTSAQTKLVDLRQKKEELLMRFQEEHPAVVAITQQMQALNRELASVDAKIRRLPAVEQDVVRLTRDVKVNTDVYTAILGTAHQLRLLTATKVGSVRMLDVPVTPAKPIKPRRLFVVALAGLAGLVLGVIAAFVKKTVYRRVNHPAEVEQLLGLHVSATIPHSDRQKQLYALIKSESKEVAVLPQVSGSDAAVEGLRSFRSSLKHTMLNASNNVIMITGPTPGVGKSFVSANLASLLASIGKKVLLIDGDLRTGYLHRYFAKNRENGLSDVLLGRINFGQAIHKDVVENVDFISTGKLPDKPTELLEHQNFDKLIQLLSARYDFVLIDTPPVLAFADALTVGSSSGAIFNVVRSGISTVDEIEATVKRLNQAGRTVTGIVFNGAKPGFTRYAYGSGYGKYAYA